MLGSSRELIELTPESCFLELVLGREKTPYTPGNLPLIK